MEEDIREAVSGVNVRCLISGSYTNTSISLIE
jgi:hypothetical protein